MDRRLKIAVTIAVIVVLVASFFVYDTTLKGSAPSNGTITVRDSLGRNGSEAGGTCQDIWPD